MSSIGSDPVSRVVMSNSKKIGEKIQKANETFGLKQNRGATAFFFFVKASLSVAANIIKAALGHLY